MKKTIIENRWMKMVNGSLCECKVFWHYIPNEQPTIFIQGYNPFPFFGKQGIKTTLEVFNKWMRENGWTQKFTVTGEYLHVTVNC